MRRPPSALSIAFVALLAATVRGGGEWPRFRGPDGAGVSDATTIPVEWTAEDYNWRVELPGSGHSSPVVWGSRIFLTCADEKTARRIVCCLRADDGKLLWKREYPSKPYRQHHFNHYASASPAADKRRVYVTWTTPDEVTLLALSHDGPEVWRRHLGTFAATHGSGSSPIVFDDLVILANDQKGDGASIIAVDSTTGKTRWAHPRNNSRAAYGTPCIYRPADGPPEIIVASTSHGIAGLDPPTGRLRWEQRGIFPQRCVGSPAVARGLIVATCGVGGRGVVAVAVRPGSQSKKLPPKVAYRVERPVPYVPTPIARGDLLFLWSDQGVVTCLRGATGQRLWQRKVGGNFFGSPVRVGGRLYCISKKGNVVVLAAAEEFKALGRNPLGEGSCATPAIAGGRMYLRTLTHLISVGGK